MSFVNIVLQHLLLFVNTTFPPTTVFYRFFFLSFFKFLIFLTVYTILVPTEFFKILFSLSLLDGKPFLFPFDFRFIFSIFSYTYWVHLYHNFRSLLMLLFSFYSSPIHFSRSLVLRIFPSLTPFIIFSPASLLLTLF